MATNILCYVSSSFKIDERKRIILTILTEIAFLTKFQRFFINYIALPFIRIQKNSNVDGDEHRYTQTRHLLLDIAHIRF